MFIRILTAAFLFLFIAEAKAQTDSTQYDLGRISVKKGFTQSITIKASDLERYQFSDLADALNVWLYGTYSNSSTLTYVVNGNIITDVNAYSIYDVDEITLVQNAMAQVSGAAPGAQMVLIKLKTNRPGKQGLDVAGQTSLVNSRNATGLDLKSTNNFYDQYYLGGYRNFNNAHFGVSADYQHDVSPYLSSGSVTIVNPFHSDRFKLNAYADAKLWTGTSLNFNVNYVPQTTGFEFSNITSGQLAGQSINDAVVQHMVSSAITLNSTIGKGLTNTLSAAYNHYNYFANDSLYNQTSFGGPTNSNLYRLFGYINARNFLLRDNLSYHARLGAIDIEPSANFSYRDFRNTSTETSTLLSQTNGAGFTTATNSMQGVQENFKLYLLTPSLNIYYKDIVNIQGGFVGVLNPAKDFSPGYQVPRLSPFISASVGIINPSSDNTIALRVFGSYSRQNALFDDPYATLAGVAQGNNSTNSVTPPVNNTGTIYISSAVNPYHQYNNYQAGLVLTLLKNFSVNYNYGYNENIDFETIIIPVAPNGSVNGLVLYYDQVRTNRIGFNYNLITADLNWRMGLNIAQSKVQPAIPSSTAYSAYLSNGHRYSGGFTNRLTYQSFFAGLDVLYQIGERPLTLQNIDPYYPSGSTNFNSFSLQNLYAGLKIKVKGVNNAELYATTRNILQNKTSDITDNRRFYGLGFKLSLK